MDTSGTRHGGGPDVGGVANAAAAGGAANATAGGIVKSVCMDAEEIERSLTRMAHQILETNHGAENIALVGILTRGDVLAKRLVERIEAIEGVKVPFGQLDISFYRDDYITHLAPEVLSTDIPFSVDNKIVVLVDDVLYTGRTIRAALDALMDIGRASKVQLAVLVDRGHRELPIRADFVGKNVPSASDENVRLFLEEVDGYSAVEILAVEKGQRIGSAPLGSAADSAKAAAAGAAGEVVANTAGGDA